VSKTKDLTKLFESHRSRLHAVAYRMLGSASESDDAVQETWLRLSSADASEVANFGGWLTTVVARVCLDMLRSRRSRGEEALDTEVFGPIAASESNPEQEALLADSVGVALLVVLDTLSPAERVAFVLHDVFDLPFEEIAPIVDRTPEAARQLASRARRRVRRGETNTDLQSQRVVVDAFLAALRAGDFDGLLAVLDPEFVVRMDRAHVARGAHLEIRTVEDWARLAMTAFSRYAPFVQPALINGSVGVVLAPGGKLSQVVSFTVANGKITQIDIIANRDRLKQLDLSLLDE
jgi:RNA polymerase sigma-70 factor, ECF subfamily